MFFFESDKRTRRVPYTEARPGCSAWLPPVYSCREWKHFICTWAPRSFSQGVIYPHKVLYLYFTTHDYVLSRKISSYCCLESVLRHSFFLSSSIRQFVIGDTNAVLAGVTAEIREVGNRWRAETMLLVNIFRHKFLQNSKPMIKTRYYVLYQPGNFKGDGRWGCYLASYFPSLS